jgi:hypothetical protein
MDFNKYVDENIDDIIDLLNSDKTNFNEEDIKESIDYVENDNLIKKQNRMNDCYYANLINVYMKYYNKLNNTNKHLYSDLTNEFKTNAQIDLFTALMFKFNNYMEEMGIIDNRECLKYIKTYNNFIKSVNIDDVYILTFNETKLYSQNLIIIFNYIVVENIDDWNIVKIN